MNEWVNESINHHNFVIGNKMNHFCLGLWHAGFASLSTHTAFDESNFDKRPKRSGENLCESCLCHRQLRQFRAHIQASINANGQKLFNTRETKQQKIVLASSYNSLGPLNVWPCKQAVSYVSRHDLTLQAISQSLDFFQFLYSAVSFFWLFNFM